MSKTKCKQKLIAEMPKRYERVPIDRRLAGFKYLFLLNFLKENRTLVCYELENV